MSKPKYTEIINKLNSPVISSGQLIKLGVPKTYVYRFVNYLSGKKLHKIERGKYALSENPFHIAGYLVRPSYISLFAALYLRGVLMQTVNIIDVISVRKRTRNLVFNNTRIRFHKINKRMFFGYQFMFFDGFQIPVAFLEKALVDLAYLGYSPSGTLTGEINVSRLSEYSKYLGEETKKRLERWLDAFE